MREGIHPNYYQAKVVCNCGNEFVTGSTKEDMNIDKFIEIIISWKNVGFFLITRKQLLHQLNVGIKKINNEIQPPTLAISSHIL